MSAAKPPDRSKMTLPSDSVSDALNRCIRLKETYRPFLDRLAGLFAEMDRAYAEVADRFAFRCSGCGDNCCLTRFYHHTLLEYLMLAEGFSCLGAPRRATVAARSREVCATIAAADAAGRVVRIMCPPNEHGPGMLYDDTPHGFRGSSEEMAAPIPRLRFLYVDETQVRFMHQRRRLQSLANSSTTQLRRSELAQFGIDKRQ